MPLPPQGRREGRYHTVVVDPPWPYAKFGDFDGKRRAGPLFPTMSVDEIRQLPVGDLARRDGCHLYLWTTTRFLRDAFDVLDEWGFSYSTTLTWIKQPMGAGMGGAFHPSTEFVLFARRGSLAPLQRFPRSHFHGKRPYNSEGKPMSSAKPEAFMDLVEIVSPEPRFEMFSRRARLGWETWGDEALHGTEAMA